jgi:hypothetical protein
MITLDRILVSTEWEHKYPLCFAWSKTRVGSDHWLIFLDTGENLIRDRNLFILRSNGCWRTTLIISFLETGSQ